METEKDFDPILKFLEKNCDLFYLVHLDRKTGKYVTMGNMNLIEA